MKTYLALIVGLSVLAGGAAVPEGAEVVVGPEGKFAPFKTAKKHAAVQLHFEWLLDQSGEGTRNSPDSFNRAFVNFPGAGRIFVNNSSRADGRHTGQCEAIKFAGAIEAQNPPIVNTTREVGSWNAMDVVYRPAKWEGTNLVSCAEITVFHNGVVVQDHWGMEGDMQWIFRPSGPKPQPAQQLISFEPGWNQKVRFRNVWVKDMN